METEHNPDRHGTERRAALKTAADAAIDQDERRLARNERARQRRANTPTPMQLIILQNATSGAAIDFGWNQEGGGMGTRLEFTRATHLLQRRGWIMLYRGVYSITAAGREAYLKGTT